MTKKGMTEDNFKLLVFLLMVAGNVAAFTCLFVLGVGAGGFTPAEGATTAPALVSVFAAYFSVMLGEFIASRSDEKPVEPRRVGRRFVLGWVVFLVVYFFLLCLLINCRAGMEFQTFTNWLTAFQTGLGVFVGQIIHALFKKREGA